LAKKVVSDRTVARAEARAKAREVAAKKAAGAKKRKLIAGISGGVAVLGVVAGAVFILVTGVKVASGDVPSGVTSITAPYVIGSAKAPKTIDLYEDFRCPVCRQFEAAYGDKILSAINSGQLRVRYHMLSFLTATDRSASRRAANAAAVAYNLGGEAAFLKFHTWAYINQPDETVDGFFPEQLAALGSTLGIKDSARYAADVKSIAFGSYVDAVNGAMLKDKINGTPTVRLNGKDVNWTDPASFIATLGLKK
jgi:protein-disulfide isomerase